MRRVVYYDLSRLVNRSDAHHPTGIDRVDIRYAKYFLENDKTDFYGLMQVGGVLFLMPVEATTRFVEALFHKWRGDGKQAFNFAAFKKEQLALGEDKAAKSHDAVHPQLLRLFEKNRAEDPLYFNCSHYGISENVKALQTMKVLGRARLCYYLHDLIPIDYPEYVRRDDDLMHFERVKVMLLFGDIIYVNSKFTQKRIQTFCEQYGYAAPLIVVTRIGVEDCFLSNRIDAPRLLADKVLDNYFVYVSTIEPRKNHTLLLNIWRQLVAEVENPPYLVLVGQRGWNNGTVFDCLDRSLAFNNHVIELNDVDDLDLVAIVKYAKASLFPSFSEGWGMPLVESAALKTPVICSDIEVFHEAGQETMVYINNIDAVQWEKTILTFFESEDARSKRVNLLSNFDIPLWEDHFHKVEYGLGLLPAACPLCSEQNQNILNDFSSFLKRKPKSPLPEQKNILGKVEACEVRIAQALSRIESKHPWCKYIFDALRKTYWYFRK